MISSRTTRTRLLSRVALFPPNFILAGSPGASRRGAVANFPERGGA
ncbi:MAG TPA: hypothetical protein VOA64_08540 [Candidatus Dormibacteraeota bacterium]|nr:hypothetical protein [Candidatus Dormibacteraeota bacterium]